MCGIYGINKRQTKEQLYTILKLADFRGPDYTGISIRNSYSFGHNRLAIIDLDSRSNQPFKIYNYEIVFNGEIYNYQEIKDELIKVGYEFNTNSDTEVLLVGYKVYGEKILDKLNGMFAFVIYDAVKNIFFGARDRLGKKPFYYYKRDDIFEFASQLKQIIFQKDLEIDKKSEKLYFRYGYVPEPYTIFEDVYKLEAGYSFTYDLNSFEFTKKQYWDISTSNEHFINSYETIKKDLKELIIDSIKQRLHSDVPIGVFLSGGVDSSLVSSIVVKELGQKLDTFSIKFSDAKFDESNIAKDIATILGTKHHTLDCKPEDMIDLIENLNEYYDEPYNDSSSLAMMILSRETRKYVTVALSGDGGDELFWGYNNYFRMAKVRKLYEFPKFVRSAISYVLNKSSNYRFKKIADGLKIDTLEELFLYSGRLFDFEKLFNQKNILCQDEYKKYLYSQKDFFERMSDYDIKTYMNGDIFTKVDRGTMAYGLEARTPLVDYKVIEFSQKIPFEYKYKNGSGKNILKDILYDYLPKEIFDRPKSGFTIPLRNWFRDELREYVYETLSEKNLQKIDDLNISYIKEMIENHMNAKENNYHQIWTLISYIKWMEKYYEK
ncbi:asparagine synthase (glutamine-hydrolyzing, glutamine amidotransferase class-II domain) [Aliarcobacter faecis]|uniref:asparagine synthase (glutamine-hydrolyzing) n=1 Tax=Aliarcobacter faecis TaxID=1564138 RepID=UPI00047E6C32|nr:asparagine synthase (glutamine-hydrolyzing) [Aliarcobacter faecis]QKF73464.1 asparagine synthase (glutamine-hydrolyzing, glutamine amidotransferase class-II domain) [Aliarcobacter faecis]